MLAGAGEITLTVPPGATIANVFQALSDAVPQLAGRVVKASGNALLDGYACNVNGLEFVRDPASPVHEGDRILLLSSDAGG
jgi:molybdopterin converting factor small subunit